MRHLLNNLELYLTGAGLGIILLLGATLRQYGYWHVLSLTAIAVGLLHGILFWAIRRRQRTLRHELIEAIRPMLADQINSRLTVLLVAADQSCNGARSHQTHVLPPESRESLEAAIRAAEEIKTIIDRLSLDSLYRWHQHYDVNGAPAVYTAGKGPREAKPAATV